MKFYIFSKREKIAKPIIYFFVVVLTIVLIHVFFQLDDENKTYNTFVFIAPVIYALLLFYVGILLEKENHRVAEKVYERNKYYLSIERVRNIMNETINKIDWNNADDIQSNVVWFQLLTGRRKEEKEGISQNENPSDFLQENGFIYTSEMLEMEKDVLNSVKKDKDVNNEPVCKLKRFYHKTNKKLERNIVRLKRIYGGEFQHLNNYRDSLSDLGLKMEAIISKTDQTLNSLEQSCELNEYYERKIDEINCDLENIKNVLEEILDAVDFPDRP